MKTLCIFSLIIIPQLFYLFFHLLTYINLSIKKSSILHTANLCLSVFPMYFFDYRDYTTQNVYHIVNVLGPQHLRSTHTKFHVALRNNQEHMSESMDLSLVPRCTFFYLGPWEQIPTCMGFHVRLSHILGLILISMEEHGTSTTVSFHLSHVLFLTCSYLSPWLCYMHISSVLYWSGARRNVHASPSAAFTFLALIFLASYTDQKRIS